MRLNPPTWKQIGFLLAIWNLYGLLHVAPGFNPPFMIAVVSTILILFA